MIIRKPYAFLIKHFRLIHAIMTACMAYLLYRSYLVYDYVNTYIKTSMLAVNEDITAELFTSKMFYIPGIIIVLIIILLVVMIRKKKPFLFYIINVFIYGASIAAYTFLYDRLNYIETNIIELSKFQLVHDVALFLLVAQGISFVICLNRSLGFDIKQFEFGKDLMELNTEEEDSEEIEVNVSVDTNVIRREFNRRKRMLKYVYLENKLLIHVSVLAFFSILFYVIYLNSTVYNVSYNEGSMFHVSGFELGVDKVFVTNKSYDGTVITKDGKTLVLVELKIKASVKDTKLNTSKTILEINDVDYYPNTLSYRDYTFDLGKTYYDEEIDNINFEKVLLAYEIPTSVSKSNFKFRYLNNTEAKNDKDNPRYIHIDVNPIYVDKVGDVQEVERDTEVILNEDTLGATTLNIKSFEIAKEFSINYIFNYKGEKINSIEYLTPTLNTNYDLVLLKINAEMSKDVEIEFSSLRSPYDLVNCYGMIEYEVDGKVYRSSKGFTRVEPSHVKSANNYYVTINKNVLSADYINLYLNVRNKSYKYKIK